MPRTSVGARPARSYRPDPESQAPELYSGVIQEIEERESANGPFLRVKIADEWLSCFIPELNDSFRVGQEIEYRAERRGKWWNIVAATQVLRREETPPPVQTAPPQGGSAPPAPVGPVMEKAIRAAIDLLVKFNIKPVLEQGWSSEDVRAVAISLFIEKERQNGRR